MTAHRHVRLSRPVHLAQAGEVLGRAFSDQPPFAHVFPDPAERHRAVAFVHRALVGILSPLGYCWATLDEGRVRAVSLWTPPGATLGVWPFVRHGLVLLPFRFGFRKVGEMMEINDLMTALRREHAPRPHYYLDILGVDPEMQGCGVGSALLRRDLADFVDPTGTPAVLWTGKARNVPFYEREGFEVLHEERFGGTDGFSEWLMARPAQGSGSAPGR